MDSGLDLELGTKLKTTRPSPYSPMRGSHQEAGDRSKGRECELHAANMGTSPRSILLMKHYPSLKSTPMRQFLTITLNKKSNSFVDFHISNSSEACICYCLPLNREQRLFIELFLIFCLRNSVSKELNSNSQLSLLLIPGLCHCLATSQNSPSQH